ncbi:MAG: hypothetical protein ACKOB5_15985 [Betaproteobacteria bacterium]
MKPGEGTPERVRLNERLGIAAAFVLLELVGAMTRDAVLAFAKSVAAYRNKYDCGYRGPNGSLSNGILKVVPFEELSGENHCKCADEDNEELLEPELEAHKVSEKCLTVPINGSLPPDYPHRWASSRVDCIGLFGAAALRATPLSYLNRPSRGSLPSPRPRLHLAHTIFRLP